MNKTLNDLSDYSLTQFTTKGKSMLRKTKFDIVKSIVKSIKNNEHSYYINTADDFPTLEKFSETGLFNAGARLNFPAKFIRTICLNHPRLAEDVVKSRAVDYFNRLNARKDKRGSNSLFIREFYSKVYGVLTDRYSVFDDDEVTDILSSSEYLMNAEEVWADVTPDRFHVRFISANKLYIDGDDSPLSMAVFIDNSMTGGSSLRIRFGIYRWACTNGVISGLKEFNILREVHHGKKDYVKLLNEALMEVSKYEEMMLAKVQEMANTKSSIYDMSEEDAIRYIKDKLNIGKKDAQKVFDAYTEEYGGETKWDLCNAITFVAHNIENIEDRIHYEEYALKVA